jgi:hypothetical protein
LYKLISFPIKVTCEIDAGKFLRKCDVPLQVLIPESTSSYKSIGAFALYQKAQKHDEMRVYLIVIYRQHFT